MADEEILNYCNLSIRCLKKIRSSIKKVSYLKNSASANLSIIEKVVKTVQEQAEQLSHPDEALQKIKNWVEERKEFINKQKEEIRFAFGRDLEKILAEKGFQLEGHYPQLKVGLFTIEVDFDKKSAIIWYGPSQEFLAKAKFPVKNVADVFFKVHKDITGARFDSDDSFLVTLMKAYKTYLLKYGGQDQQEVPIMGILQEMNFILQDKKFYANPRRESFRPYTRAYFSYDLFRLQKRTVEDYHLNLSVATRAFTTKREDFLWIPSNEKGDGCVYAFLSFKQEK